MSSQLTLRGDVNHARCPKARFLSREILHAAELGYECVTVHIDDGYPPAGGVDLVGIAEGRCLHIEIGVGAGAYNPVVASVCFCAHTDSIGQIVG